MWYRFERFTPSRPREAKGGIKSQSKRGQFGKSWWAQRWIRVLEGFNIGARLGRGRSYARNGQVLSIDIDKGVVKAKVQGSRPQPYAVTIKVAVLTGKDWKKIVTALGDQALFTAKLLAGEMPQEIEQVFLDNDLSLFPAKSKDLATDCSCPDWSNPCKHVAAVYYLIGEEFDRDPFLIFKLRGMGREELLGSLNEGVRLEKGPADVVSEPLAADATAFWNGGKLADDFFSPVETPRVAAALPKRLGSFPFWRGSDPFLDTLEPIYRAAAEKGLQVFLGNPNAGDP